MLAAGGWGLAGDMCVGACAQLTGGLLFTPVDVVKERMQVRHNGIGCELLASSLQLRDS
jgi:hypothetical protein